MDELDVRELGRHREHGGAVAERGRDDHIVAFLAKASNRALGVGLGVGDVLQERGLHVGQRCFQGQATLVVGVRPAEVPHRPDVDKGDADRLTGWGSVLSVGERGAGCESACGGDQGTSARAEVKDVLQWAIVRHGDDLLTTTRGDGL